MKATCYNETINSSTDTIIVLLTYKGKVLLTFQSRPSTMRIPEIWNFIECKRKKFQTLEESLIQQVKEHMNITLNQVVQLSKNTDHEENRYYFQGILSDTHVNQITRGENQLINFFSIAEVDNLNLTKSAKLLWLTHRDRVLHSHAE